MLSRLNRFIFSPSLRVQRTFSVKTFRTNGALKAQFFFKTKKIEMNSICRHFRFHFVFGLFKLLILITRENTRHHFET